MVSASEGERTNWLTMAILASPQVFLATSAPGWGIPICGAPLPVVARPSTLDFLSGSQPRTSTSFTCSAVDRRARKLRRVSPQASLTACPLVGGLWKFSASSST